MTDAEYSAVFKLPFKEAETFFKEKLNIPTEKWDDLFRDEHAKGFMSAGAQKAELLAGLRDAVQKSIDGGMTKKEFAAKFDELAATHGWSYKGGRNWRSSLIYDTNITTAYQAGRWQQFREGGTQFLRYVHADGVINPRPQHLAWNGTVLPIDHEFWQTHYPPNGWRCHCRAVRAEAPQVTPEPAGWRGIDPKTETLTGIDKGWDYNVGEAGMKWNPDLDKYPYPVARDLVKELGQNEVFTKWHDATAGWVKEEVAKPDFPQLDKQGTIRELRKRLTSDEKFPVAVLPENVKAMIGANTQGVYLSKYDLIKQQISRAGQDFGAMEYMTAQSAIEDALLVVKDGDYITIFVADTNKNWYVAVLQSTQTGDGVFLKSFRRSNSKDAIAQKRKGSVLLDKLP